MRYRAKSVLVANMGEILPKLKVFPEAKPDDGLIEVGVLKANGVADFLRLFFRALLGRPEEDPALDAYQAHDVLLEIGRDEPLQLDGDPIAAVRRLELKVAPGAIRIMMPRPDQVK
jgi:diacylglycerol kinase family enzyme